LDAVVSSLRISLALGLRSLIPASTILLLLASGLDTDKAWTPLMNLAYKVIKFRMLFNSLLGYRWKHLFSCASRFLKGVKVSLYGWWFYE